MFALRIPTLLAVLTITACPATECPVGYTAGADGLCLQDDADGDTGSGDTSDTDTGAEIDTGDTDSGSGDTDTGGADTSDTETADTDTGDTDTGTAPAYTVCDDGVAPYADLQDAVDDAADGDVLYLCPGTYDRIELDRVELSLVGDDPETTTIDGGGHTAVYATESTLSLSGIGLTGQAAGSSEESLAAGLYLGETTFTGTNLLVQGCSGTGYGVTVKASDATFDGLRIESSALTGGFVATSGGTLHLQHVVITGITPATATLGGQALYVDTDSFEVSNLLAYGNEAADAFAVVELQDASSGWLYNAVISGNDTRGAALLVRGAATTVENVIVADNAASIGISANGGAVAQYSDAYGNLTNFEGDAAAGTGNLSANPRFVDAAGGDFTLDAGFSPCIDAGNPLAGYNDADGSRNDMGAFGGPAGNAW